MAFQYEDRPVRSRPRVPPAPAAASEALADAIVREIGSAPPAPFPRHFYGQTAEGRRVTTLSPRDPEAVHALLTARAGAPLVHFWYTHPNVPFAPTLSTAGNERQDGASGWDATPMTPPPSPGPAQPASVAPVGVPQDIMGAAMVQLIGMGWQPPGHALVNPHLRISDRMDDFLRYIDHRSTMHSEVSDFRTTLNIFTQLVGDLHLADIEATHTDIFLEALRVWPVNATRIRAYRGMLAPAIVRKAKQVRETPIHLRTQQSHVYRLRTFFRWLETRKELKPDLLKGIKLVTMRTAPRKSRSPFDEKELEQIFSCREVAHATKPFKFWLPILGMYTGMRVREICQLYLADVIQIEGRWYFQVTNSRPGQQIKTPQSERKVPIHEQIMDAGFLDYVDEVQRSGLLMLFPELWTARWDKRVGPGSPASAWFNRLLRKRLGIVSSERTFHSLRHGFATYAANTSGIQMPLISELLGHMAGVDSLRKIYRALANPQQLAKALDAIVFPPMHHAKYQSGYFDPVLRQCKAQQNRQAKLAAIFCPR